jgi:DNA-binding SARP family transcriptional activator
MARPFRFQPPAPAALTLPRPRLLEQLARRSDRRLVTVVAGPGFGKTALLVAAIAQGRAVGTPRDVWLSCEPADESADHLCRAVGDACGLVAGDFDTISDWIWAQAPDPVSLVLDDVHEIPPRSDGAAFVARLVSDLPGNGHVVLASRVAVPVSLGRLAASGQLVRIREEDLVLADDELGAFARARDVEPSLLASTGGWPALAELTASAGADLVLDYIWEEVLAQIGPGRAQLLARFALVGGGDDSIASALAGRPVRVDDLVDGVPLVQRSATGLATLHALWAPALRTVLSPEAIDEARRTAASVHRASGRSNDAIELLAEAGAWDEVLAVIRDTETMLAVGSAADFGRWYRMLPHRWRDSPVALLASGLALRPLAPAESIPVLEAATRGFRDAGDVEGEVAAISAHGTVLWWSNDPLKLFGLHVRVTELAATGSAIARFVAAIGTAAIAHLMGDSAGVFAALADVDDTALPAWLPVVQWLRSVAHRREGDLQPALAALDAVPRLPDGSEPVTFEHARLRTQWLLGDVDHVRAHLPAVRDRFEQSGDRFNTMGVVLEIATKDAWVGEADPGAVLAGVPDIASPEAESPMAVTMQLMADASIAVAEGDETRAADLLRADTVAMIGRPDGWYWRDRAAVALVHVLVPETRDAWEREPLASPHRVGLVLARALEAAREGDASTVAALRWPEAGIVRAHLPLRWAAELAATAAATDNRAPDALLAALGTRLRAVLQQLVNDPHTQAPTVAGAKKLLASLPAVPASHVHVNVLGPLEVRRDDAVVTDPELRRQRVRELLCFLVAHTRARREEITDQLWPELDDRGRNLRVTLNYLQHVLQPERTGTDPPYFVRSDGPWLALEGLDRLDVDAWRLDALLDAAERADRAGAPAVALAGYGEALPLWRGEPYADLPYTAWAEVERARLRTRYTAAALRSGELLLAAGAPADARTAAQRAIMADPTREVAYQLLARTHLAEDDRAGARHAIDACVVALAELDVEPDRATMALLGGA